MLLIAVLAGALLSGCMLPAGPVQSGGGAAAPLRGFAVGVDEALAPRVPSVHLRVCGGWGCDELDVPLMISGRMSPIPCTSDTCGAVQIPSSGPGYGYAPVPKLTMDAVTVTVTAPLVSDAPVTVRPTGVCPGTASGCADPTPQGEIRIAADGTVSQSR
ncbi:hypothetical protein [Dactylosporangium sp. CS-033363]|uniref:hypothetical protein n=1 Tax=Dactylosporangium sp. CS-033363 TaxID=3239935 RepID=UPI003D8EC50D